MRKFMFGLAVAAFALTLNAQQLELNSATASLTRAGANPVVGTPYTVYGNQSFDFRVGGNPSSGFILLLGTLATSSTQPLAGFGITDYLDLDQGAGIQIIGDGISFSSTLPGSWFFTNASGQSDWVVPTSPTMWGTNIDMQTILTDTALPPFFLNFSAAGRWAITGLIQTIFQGDDITQAITTSHAYPLYGANRTQFVFCTNGQGVAGAVGSTSYTTSTATFNSGLVTGSPSFAPLWDDLYMYQQYGRQCAVIEDPTAQYVRCEWQNINYFAQTTGSIGTISMTITDVGGVCQVDYDYSAFVGNAQRGLVGISDGNVATTSTSAGDLVTAGVVNSYVSPATADTYYQDFSLTPLDLAGVILHWLDTSGNGDWLLY